MTLQMQRQSSDKHRDHKSGGILSDNKTYVDSEDYHRYNNSGSSNNSSPNKHHSKQQQQSGRASAQNEEEDYGQNEYHYSVQEPKSYNNKNKKFHKSRVPVMNKKDIRFAKEWAHHIEWRSINL